MKCYYNMQVDYKLIKVRLNFLKEKKEMLESAVTNCTSKYQERTGNDTNDKMAKYLERIAEIEEELKLLEQEKKIIEKCLNEMKKVYKQAVGIEREVFRLFFIEGKQIKDISKEIKRSSRMVYNYIDIISQKYKLDEK